MRHTALNMFTRQSTTTFCSSNTLQFIQKQIPLIFTPSLARFACSIEKYESFIITNLTLDFERHFRKYLQWGDISGILENTILYQFDQIVIDCTENKRTSLFSINWLLVWFRVLRKLTQLEGCECHETCHCTNERSCCLIDIWKRKINSQREQKKSLLCVNEFVLYKSVLFTKSYLYKKKRFQLKMCLLKWNYLWAQSFWSVWIYNKLFTVCNLLSNRFTSLIVPELNGFYFWDIQFNQNPKEVFFHSCVSFKSVWFLQKKKLNFMVHWEKFSRRWHWHTHTHRKRETFSRTITRAKLDPYC